MKIEDASTELIEKAKACETPEQIFELAKKEGIDLTDEQTDAIAAGAIEGFEGAWNNSGKPSEEGRKIGPRW